MLVRLLSTLSHGSIIHRGPLPLVVLADRPSVDYAGRRGDNRHDVVQGNLKLSSLIDRTTILVSTCSSSEDSGVSGLRPLAFFRPELDGSEVLDEREKPAPLTENRSLRCPLNR